MSKEIWKKGEPMNTHQYDLWKLQHRLTNLSDTHPGLPNYNVNIKEFNNCNLTIVNQLVNICVEQQKQINYLMQELDNRRKKEEELEEEYFHNYYLGNYE